MDSDARPRRHPDATVRVRRGWFSLLSFVLTAASVASAQDFSKVEVQTVPLAENLLLLQGAGGNMLACTGPGGVLLVDSDYAQIAGKVLAATAALESGSVRVVINTHWHFDHTGGNEALVDAGALIVAGTGVRECMATDRHLDLIDMDVPASPHAALPTVSVPDSLTLHWGDETVRVVHTPRAHTDGDLLVYFVRADVIHVGDLCFAFGYPYVDTAQGGSVDGVIEGIERVLARCGERTRIVPGHGPVMGRQELAVYVRTLREFRDIVAAAMRAGKTLEEIIREQPTRTLDARYGQAMFSPEMFTRMVWASLGGE